MLQICPPLILNYVLHINCIIVAFIEQSNLHPYVYANLVSTEKSPAMITPVKCPPPVKKLITTPNLPLRWLGDISDT